MVAQQPNATLAHHTLKSHLPIYSEQSTSTTSPISNSIKDNLNTLSFSPHASPHFSLCAASACMRALKCTWASSSGDSHEVEMKLASNVFHDDGESTFGFGSPSSPQLPGKAKRRSITRRHMIIRLISSPFAAVFRTRGGSTACARGEEDQASNGVPGEEHGDGEASPRSRPRLEELLRIEALSNPETKAEQELAPCNSPSDSAMVVFDITVKDVSSSSEEVAVDEAAMAISVPIVDDQMKGIAPVVLEGGHAAPLDAVISVKSMHMNVKELVLAALRARSRSIRIDMWTSKGSPSTLPGRRGADKAELFYYRPIPLGRRCQVQHLEDCPYV